MPSFGQNLTAEKAEMIEQINTIIGELRASFATHIAFQEEAYYKKRAEAEAYIATQPVDMTNFPLLAQIAPIRGKTPLELANLWITTNDQWSPVLNATEVVREKGVVAVSAATNRNEIADAWSQFMTDMEALSPS